LNFDEGDLIPNAVQVGLPTSGANAGKIDITYDAFGVAGPSTDLLIDVVGYMVAVDAGSDVALLARIDALDAEIVALKAGVATNTSAVSGLHNSMSAYAGGDQELVLDSGAVVRTVSLMPPSNGKVIVNSSGYVFVEDAAGAIIRCSITQGTDLDFTALQFAQIPPSSSPQFDSDVIAGTRGYDVAQGVLFTVNLVCDRFSGNAKVSDTWLSAIFTPA
jgi:hypothetical protein